jgi:predicted DNA-binding antitoxin AbrB/MazE fold protein
MLRTVEAIYENGLLRPLEPIQDRQDQMYLITIVTTEAVRASKHFPASTNLRGKYRGMLSSADEFARNKANEKALER